VPIDSREITELFGALRILFDDDTVLAIMDAAADAIGIQALDNLGDVYPPKPPGPDAPSPLVTPKQKRWWWAMMNKIADGEEVPETLRGWKVSRRKVHGRKTLVIAASSGYKRTGTLVRSINYEVRRSGQGITVAIGPSMARESTAGTEADYADWVIGMPPPVGKQARIHQDRWVPLQIAIERMAPELLDKFEEELIEQIRTRLKGHLYGLTGSAVK
jgi:hypothetical protein